MNGSLKFFKLANFVEEIFMHLLKRSQSQTDEPLQRKMKNTTKNLKSPAWELKWVEMVITRFNPPS